MEQEITKAEFKVFYFRYATPNSGWTEEYWNHFHKHEEGKRYFFTNPATPESTRMFIVSDDDKHRMVFLSEESEESFFDFSGKK